MSLLDNAGFGGLPDVGDVQGRGRGRSCGGRFVGALAGADASFSTALPRRRAALLGLRILAMVLRFMDFVPRRSALFVPYRFAVVLVAKAAIDLNLD